MTKNEKACGMARDLMPLCIDGAASEESVRYVDAHVAACEECAAYYQGMKADAPPEAAREETREKAAFDREAARMNKMRRMRRWRSIALGALAGILLLVGLYVGWQQLFVYDNAEVPASDYRVSLARLQNKNVVVCITYQGTGAHGTSIRETKTDDGYTMSVYLTCPILKGAGAQVKESGFCTVVSDIETYDAIEQGAKNPITVYQRGGEIPPASAEMEAYFKACLAVTHFKAEALLAHLDGQPDAAMYAQGTLADDVVNALSEEEQAEYDSLVREAETLRERVPEWQ